MARPATKRWMNGTLVIDNTVVGTIQPDAFKRGWWAHGCDADWEDVKLGLHSTEAKAKKSVEDWVKSYG